jgi:hypothetical protein
MVGEQLEVLPHVENPMTSSGIETAIFWLVAKRLKQLR